MERLLNLYRLGESCSEIARLLKRTETSVRLKLLSLGYSSRKIRFVPIKAAPEFAAAALERPSRAANIDGQALLDVDLQRRRARVLVEEAKNGALEERLIEDFRNQLSQLPTTVRLEMPSPASKLSTDDVAVLLIGDVHVGQVIDPDEIEGLGNYNPAVMIDRVHHLQNELLRILQQRPVEKLIILFCGDIVHGRLGHSLEDDLTLPLATQLELAICTFFPFVANLCQTIRQVEIHGVCGNHGRWPGMRKMPSERRWSNLDGVFYAILGMLCETAGLPVSYDCRISSRRTIKIHDLVVELLHGDEIRGGQFAINGISKEVANATFRNVQAGRPAPNLFVMGDKHFSASLPFGKSAFLVNGSFVGPDNHSLNFIPAPPSQTLFFVRKGIGKDQIHEIPLQHAPPRSKLPYEYKPHLKTKIQRYRNPEFAA